MTDPALPSRFLPPAGLSWGYFLNAAGLSVRWAFAPLPEGQGPPKGHIVILPGFKEPIEKYFEAVRDLHSRGYAVWMMDWPGQGGSARYLPHAPHRAHHRGYAGQIDTLRQFLVDIVRPAAGDAVPVHLMAHSMGGHIALRFLHDHNAPDSETGRRLVQSALLTAPMVDIATGPLPRPLVRQLVFLARVGGFLERYVPGGIGWVAPKRGADGRLKTPSADLNPATSTLTADPERIEIMAQWFMHKPEIALGDPTYGWVDQTLQSIRVLNREHYLAAIDTPVLMQVSGDDRVVVPAASLRAAALMPQCTVVEIPAARHEIWMERDSLRTQWLKAMDDFLRKTAVAPVAAKKNTTTPKSAPLPPSRPHRPPGA